MAERDAAPAGELRKLALGRCPGHAQTSLRSLRNANCYAGTTKSPRQELAETRPVSYRGRREARPGADKTLPDGAPRGGCAMRMSGADCVNCLRVAQHHRTGLRFPAHRPPSSFSATRAVRGQ